MNYDPTSKNINQKTFLKIKAGDMLVVRFGEEIYYAIATKTPRKTGDDCTRVIYNGCHWSKQVYQDQILAVLADENVLKHLQPL